MEDQEEAKKYSNKRVDGVLIRISSCVMKVIVLIPYMNNAIIALLISYKYAPTSHVVNSES